METVLPASAADGAARLGDTGSLCDDALATVTNRYFTPARRAAAS